MSDKKEIDDATIERLKAEHGDVWVLETVDYSIVFRRPKPAEFNSFLDLQSDPKRSAEALRRLGNIVVVYPEKEEFRRMLERSPGLTVRIGNEAAAVGMDAATNEAKKA